MNKKALAPVQILGIIILILVFLYFFTDWRILVQEGSFLNKLAGIFK